VTDERGELPGRDFERDAGERFGAALAVAEVDIVEADFAAYILEFDGAGSIDDLLFEVEVVEDALEEGEGAEDSQVHGEELIDWLVHAGKEARHGNDRPERGFAADDPVAAVPVDDRRGEAAEDTHRRHEEPSGHRAADVERADFLRALFEALLLHFLAAEGLHEQRAADAQGFLHLAVELRELFLGAAHEVALDVADTPRRDREDGDEDDREERQPPIEVEHEGEGGGGDDDVAEDAAKRIADHLLDAADIVRDAGEDLASAVGGEPAEGHAAEVAVEVAPEFEHDSLADDVAEVGHDHAEDGGDCDERRHREDEEVQEVTVAAAGCCGEGIIDDALDEPGRAEARHGVRDNGEHQQGDHSLVAAMQRKRSSEGGPGGALRPLLAPAPTVGAVRFGSL
jgi:hypothetical protein